MSLTFTLAPPPPPHVLAGEHKVPIDPTNGAAALRPLIKSAVYMSGPWSAVWQGLLREGRKDIADRHVTRKPDDPIFYTVDFNTPGMMISRFYF